MMTRDEFVSVIRDLRRSLKEHPDEWENRDLDSYLEAIGGWVEDMDGVFRNRGEEPPTDIDWTIFGRALKAATIYE
jgi:hypothetical protein